MRRKMRDPKKRGRGGARRQDTDTRTLYNRGRPTWVKRREKETKEAAKRKEKHEEEEQRGEAGEKRKPEKQAEPRKGEEEKDAEPENEEE